MEANTFFVVNTEFWKLWHIVCMCSPGALVTVAMVVETDDDMAHRVLKSLPQNNPFPHEMQDNTL